MSTLQTANGDSLKHAVQDLNNPGLLSRATEITTDRQDIDKALRIASVLQTTLDLKKVLEIFLSEASRWVPLGNATYRGPNEEVEIRIGDQAEKHSVAYRLAVTEQPLGEITFTRKKKFTIKENKVLEYLLCGLVYPLRNALAYESALQAALKDPLTGINNRAAMDSSMVREIELARRHDTPLSLVAADIDYFKHINDSYGHATGDCVLRAVVDAIKTTVRGTDMVFRYGGEEFMILLSNTGHEGALLLANRIRRQVEKTEILCKGIKISATISLGVSWLTPEDTEKSLFERADKALYDAKAGGRNCVKHIIK
jgi:diguanylate cyclase (GGDEF)-like protein